MTRRKNSTLSSDSEDDEGGASASELDYVCNIYQDALDALKTDLSSSSSVSTCRLKRIARKLRLSDREIQSLRRDGKRAFQAYLYQYTKRQVAACQRRDPSVVVHFMTQINRELGLLATPRAMAGLLGLKSIGVQGERLLHRMMGRLIRNKSIEHMEDLTLSAKTFQEWIRRVVRLQVDLLSRVLPTTELTDDDRRALEELLMLILMNRDPKKGMSEFKPFETIQQILARPDRPSVKSVREAIEHMGSMLTTEERSILLASLRPATVPVVQRYLDNIGPRMISSLEQRLGGLSSLDGKKKEEPKDYRADLIELLSQLSRTALARVPLYDATSRMASAPASGAQRFYRNMVDMCLTLRRHLLESFQRGCTARHRRRAGTDKGYASVREMWYEDTDEECQQVEEDVGRLDEVVDQLTEALAALMVAEPASYTPLQTRLLKPPGHAAGALPVWPLAGQLDHLSRLPLGLDGGVAAW